MLTIKPENGFVETVEVLDEVRDIRVPAPSSTSIAVIFALKPDRTPTDYTKVPQCCRLSHSQLLMSSVLSTPQRRDARSKTIIAISRMTMISMILSLYFSFAL